MSNIHNDNPVFSLHASVVLAILTDAIEESGMCPGCMLIDIGMTILLEAIAVGVISVEDVAEVLKMESELAPNATQIH